jgi:predicted DNA-binding transcriptional regulator YafY
MRPNRLRPDAPVSQQPAGPHILSAAQRRFAMAFLLLDEPQCWTRSQLCEHYSLSSRQLDKDLAILRTVFRVQRRRGGYVLERVANNPDLSRSPAVSV